MSRVTARLFFFPALLLTASLAFSAVQCVTNCVEDASMPPCHSHAHDSGVCSHPIVVAVLIRAPHIAPQTPMNLPIEGPQVGAIRAIAVAPFAMPLPPEPPDCFSVRRV